MSPLARCIFLQDLQRRRRARLLFLWRLAWPLALAGALFTVADWYTRHSICAAPAASKPVLLNVRSEA